MKSPLPDAAAGKLTPTLTYSYRGYNWVRCPALSIASVPIDGLLALRLKKFKGGEELDVYAVLYEGELPFEGHAFLLHNVFDTDQPDTYRVCVGPVVTCSCKSGKTNPLRACKHRDSLSALIHRLHTEVAMPEKTAGPRLMQEPQYHPDLTEVVLLKCEHHLSRGERDTQPRYTVVEKITRQRADEQRITYFLRTNSMTAGYREIEVSAGEILGPAEDDKKKPAA